MKNTLVSLILCLIGLGTTCRAEDISIYDLQVGSKYYIYNTYYKRPLGQSADATQPRLVAYNASNDSQYQWEAISVPTDGYVMLKNVASGKYLQASTSNSYSVLLNATAGTGDSYQWMVNPGTKGWLINKRNTGSRLGVDVKETSEYIGVWYDKSASADTTTCFRVFKCDGNGFDSSYKTWAMTELKNTCEYTNSELDLLSAVFKKRMTNSITTANQWMENPDKHSAEDFAQKSIIIRDSIATLLSVNSSQINVLLTESDMDSFGSTFSLGLSGTEMNSKYDADSALVIIRNTNGRGAKYPIREKGEYVFVFKNNMLLVYDNNTLKTELHTCYLPKYTPQDTEAEWSIIRKDRITGSCPEVLSETKEITTPGTADKNKYGNYTRTVLSLNNVTMNLDSQIDFHLLNNNAPLKNCSINLIHEKAWLIFDNVKPSTVESTYLDQIKINGSPAVNNDNCRIVIYLNGAVVMPYDKYTGVFTGYDGEQYSGKSVSYGLGNVSDMSKNSNRFRSFRLKRGYMVTLATDTKGGGYSRVYVADHKDIEVPVMPDALRGRVSSIFVRKWQYVSKKGWCSTSGGIKGEASKMNATWVYNWAADNSSSMDQEYVPIKQHIYWPSFSDNINWRTDCTAVLGYNEPDHSEQHNDCACGGSIDAWKAYTHANEFMASGLRVGSPCPTDDNWLKEYVNNCNNMATRVDFVTFHSYWGSNEANDGNAWYNRLKAIYDATKRPIWITEWAYGASWTKESWPDGWGDKLEQNRWRIKDIQQKLEQAPFVERYAYYQWDTQFRNFIDWSDGHITPAGKVYRDMKSGFAYNSDYQFTPVWWAPGLKTPTVKLQVEEADLDIIIKNDNGDLTDVLTIQKKTGDGEWEEFFTETNRYKFDNKTLNYKFPLTGINLDTDQFRVYVKTTLNKEVYSPVATSGLITNPTITATSKTNIEGWTCTKNAANGYTKADNGDTYFEVWDANPKGMSFDYYQVIEGIPSGIYELSGKVFNSTNDVNGAQVNGSVVLYAQADSVQYVANVTSDCKMENAEKITISNIYVLGDSIRIGIKNIGEMTARWAGGDDFRLIRTGDLPEEGLGEYFNARIQQDEHSRELFFTSNGDAEETSDAVAYIINPNDDRSNNYGWTTTNVESSTGKSYDNISTNAYWNLWKNSAFTAKMSQDITFLPEGQYSVTLIARGGTNETIRLIATVTSGRTGEQSTVSKEEKGLGEINGTLPNGWFKMTTPFITVRPGDVLNITMEAKGENGSSWYSIDNFGLTYKYVEPFITGIDQPTVSNSATSHHIYDMTGRKVTTPAKGGIYIINGRKVIIK